MDLLNYQDIDWRTSRRAITVGVLLYLFVSVPSLVYLSKHSKPTNESYDVKENIVSDMVLVKGGVYIIGYDEEGADYSPAHEVQISDFYISKHPVTHLQYEELTGGMIIKDGESGYKLFDRDEAIKFINTLRSKTGIEFEMPTEAQWEYIARNGIADELGIEDLYNYSMHHCADVFAPYEILDLSGTTIDPKVTKTSKKYKGWYSARGSEYDTVPFQRHLVRKDKKQYLRLVAKQLK